MVAIPTAIPTEPLIRRLGRRTKFDLDKALREIHILEGYRIATENIDEVIKIIKGSASIPDAKLQLCERFGLTDVQAQAIVEMTLGKLSGLERQKVEDRIAKLEVLIAELRSILESEEKLLGLLKSELEEIKKKYGDERRSELTEATEEIDLEDLIERHTCSPSLSSMMLTRLVPLAVLPASGIL